MSVLALIPDPDRNWSVDCVDIAIVVGLCLLALAILVHLLRKF